VSQKQAETDFKKAISIAENSGYEAADLAPVLGDMALFYEHQQKWRLAEPLLNPRATNRRKVFWSRASRNGGDPNRPRFLVLSAGEAG
jgi:hypothetical protein